MTHLVSSVPIRAAEVNRSAQVCGLITMGDHGLELVAPGTNPKVDIVFLHGLRGDKRKTWTRDDVLWPQDLLPKAIPEARIFLFGYDSGIVHRNRGEAVNTEVHSDSEDLCAKLSSERSKSNIEDRPIIFVAHSLGGLVVSQLFVHGEESSDDAVAKTIVSNIRGMIFLGTPFGGSQPAATAEMFRRVLSLFGVDSQDKTLKLLGVDSEHASELRRSFANSLNKRRMSHDPKDSIEAVFFYERLSTKIGLSFVKIVEIDSAQLIGCGDSIPVNADHRNICKFTTNEDETYAAIVSRIQRIIERLGGFSNDDVGKGDMTWVNNYGQAINVSKDIRIKEQTNTIGK